MQPAEILCTQLTKIHKIERQQPQALFFFFFLSPPPPPIVAGLSDPFPSCTRAVRALLRTLLLGEGRSQVRALSGELQDGGFGVEPGRDGPDTLMLAGL